MSFRFNGMILPLGLYIAELERYARGAVPKHRVGAIFYALTGKRKSKGRSSACLFSLSIFDLETDDRRKS